MAMWLYAEDIVSQDKGDKAGNRRRLDRDRCAARDIVGGERAVDDEIGCAVDVELLRGVRRHVVDDRAVERAAAAVEIAHTGTDRRVRDGRVCGLVAVGDWRGVCVKVPVRARPIPVRVEP